MCKPFTRKALSPEIKKTPAFRFRGCAACGPGKIRTENQDDFYLDGKTRRKAAFTCDTVPKKQLLAAVCDGMGGEAHGEKASLAAVRTIAKEKPAEPEALIQTVLNANLKVCALMDEYRERIGSTMTMLCLRGDTADLVNLGDSRCYLLRDGALHQLSTDHTQVHHMVEMGLLTKEQARTHRDRHRLSQHLGIYPDEMIIEPAREHLQVQEGDVFLLCSDGLTDMVEDPAIEETLKSTLPLSERCNSLFNQAMDNGGKDNITVLLVEVIS